MINAENLPDVDFIENSLKGAVKMVEYPYGKARIEEYKR